MLLADHWNKRLNIIKSSMQVYVPNVGLDPGVSPPGTYRLVIFDSDGSPLFVPDTALVAWSEPTLINTSGTGWAFNGYYRYMGDLVEYGGVLASSTSNSSFDEVVFNFGTISKSPCGEIEFRMPCVDSINIVQDLRFGILEDGTARVFGNLSPNNYRIHGFFTNGNIVS